MPNKHDFGDKSSLIKGCDYDDDKGALIVHFHSGQTYHYPDCPKDEYHALKQAESVGKHFWSKIRAKKSVKVK